MTSATVVSPSLLEILDEDDTHVIAPLASELVLEDASPESFNIIENNDSVVTTAESTSVAVPHFTGGAISPATAGLMGVIGPTRPKSKYVWKCSESQEAFIARTRSKIDAGVCNELFIDWMNIRPCKVVYGPNAEKVGASDYYIKPIAAWLPHLLFPGHIPYCPKCEKNDRVEVCHASWIDHPMVLYCLMGVKHLDTMRVPCTRCNHRFQLTNAKSLSLDTTGRIMGVFRVHLGKQTAVDESLYHYITNRMNDPAAAIARQLKHLTLQKYVADIIEFMLKVKMKMARIESKEGSLLVRHLSRASSATSLTAIGKERQAFEERLRNAKYKLKRVVSRKLKSVNFSAMLERKGKKRASSAFRGDESIIAIRHKSTIQLQNHYDKVQQLRSASYVSANPTGEARTAALRMALRTTRGAAPAPPITQAFPRAYPQIDIQQIPTGVPMALNPNVATVNVGRRESVQGRAPYSIRLQQNDVQIALPKPSFRAICKCCGLWS
eukprot:scaffold42804_cov34-Attheya_sp.AAC.1